MKTIIAGSRNIRDYRLVVEAVKQSGFTITEVVSGREPNGVDRLGELWADDHGIPVRLFPADWNKHGRAAGPIRNRQMAEYAEALIAIPAPDSRGTKNMIEEARKRGLQVFVLNIQWHADQLVKRTSPFQIKESV